MEQFANKRVTVLGAQKSGLAAARLARHHGAYVKLSDLKKQEQFSEETISVCEEFCHQLEFGGHSSHFVCDSDMLVLSPGVRRDAAVVQLAREKGILVLGEIEFAFQFCDPAVIAVTGSNGKTTTTTLINLVLQEAGYRSATCGNIGFPFSEFALNASGMDFAVLEVSSFQMESLVEHGVRTDKIFKEFRRFRPFIAVVLNVNENHLDRHSDMEEYFAAKTRIFENQNHTDFAVVNFRDWRLKDLVKRVAARVVFFNESEKYSEKYDANQQAVAAASGIVGISPDVCKKVFEEFPGVEHRMEKVRVVNGVTYINDSKATTAESGRWALEHVNQPVVMICGGRDKHIDFSVLAGIVKEKVKKMIVIGEARDKLEETFGGFVSVEKIDTLELAVKRAKSVAKSGDCVLLSPMCASFDMFENFEHRGKVFKDIVSKLLEKKD